MNSNNQTSRRETSLGHLFRPYTLLIGILLILTVWANALNLVIPQFIAYSIDTYTAPDFNIFRLVLVFVSISIGIFILVYLQNIMQVYIAEKVAKDLRGKIIQKISLQAYDFIEKVTGEKLLTYITSDVDAVKNFVSQAIASIASSVFLIIGASILLLWIDWQLALAVIAILPLIGIFFWIIFSRVRKLFRMNQESIDALNKNIRESIFGAALIRILNASTIEYEKFLESNTNSLSIGMQILKLFATLLPIIAFLSNMAVVLIVVLWGHAVMLGTLTLWDFTVFNSYLTLLIFPIIIIWFMSGVIAQASASYKRIDEVLSLPDTLYTGTLMHDISGTIQAENIILQFWEKVILKDISFKISPTSRTAIIGPTGAWKTLLLSILMGLVQPTSWKVLYDGINIHDIAWDSFYRQVWLVFQESHLFHLTLRENIAFSKTVTDDALEKAIKTAELDVFIHSLPQWLDTIVSERGVSLSGGQKQRIMLARALALSPKILFLDDFTARLDILTEKKVLHNIATNYPDMTVISVTQKIEPIRDYDQIILMMEGEILARWTHASLLASSPEYNQIYNSQFSTHVYEVSAH